VRRLLLPAVLGLAVALPAAPSGPDGAARARALGFLAAYCVECHGPSKAKGDLRLDDPAALDRPGPMRRVRERIALGEMPPKGRPRPPEAEAREFLAFLDRAAPGEAPPDPGRVTLRRLNRAEYRNTVRDLLGVDVRAEEEFPSDDVGYGFDNIGDVLSLPPVLFEKFVASAESIAARAWMDEERPLDLSFEGARLEHGEGAGPRGSALVLFAPSAAAARVELPRDGEYLLRITAFGQQAGPEACRMGVRVDGREAAAIEVPESAPAPHEARVRMRGGARRIAVAFLNDYYRPDAPDPKARDRNLVVLSLAVSGPLDPPPLSAFQRSIAPGTPPERILAGLLRRAWRRPAEPEEISGLAEYARAEGMRAAIAAVLASPHFLFRVEEEPPPGEARAISDHELATRLSYFLWSTMPDDALLDLADRGALREALDAEIARMLRDARSTALVENFASQWLQLRTLDRCAPDPARFPGFDDALRDAMREESLLFFEAVLREGRSVFELLDSDFTFLNERLARHYGIPGVHGDRMRRFRLPDGVRGGILTQASILTVTSNPTRTSPVKRGKWILETLLASPPPPPPPGAGVIDESAAAAGAATLRERLERHRADPECASCHAALDPLGFGLENFDAVGAWRSRDGAFPVDASGTLPDGRAFEGPRALKAILKEDPRFLRSLVRQLLVYGTGRGLGPGDEAAVDRVVAALPGRATSLADILHQVARTEAFRMRRGELR